LDINQIIDFKMLLTLFLTLVGLVSVGTLLAFLVMFAAGRHLLYPILYFPLCVPVLLCAYENMLASLTQQMALTAMLQSWLGLLLAFDLVYVTLGTMFFGELLRAD